jgi:hypothetical protein
MANLGERKIRVSMGVRCARDMPHIRGRSNYPHARRKRRVQQRRLRGFPQRTCVHVGNQKENPKALQFWLTAFCSVDFQCFKSSFLVYSSVSRSTS